MSFIDVWVCKLRLWYFNSMLRCKLNNRYANPTEESKILYYMRKSKQARREKDFWQGKLIVKK